MMIDYYTRFRDFFQVRSITVDHNEFCCIFDASQYTGTPDSHPCPRAVDVPETSLCSSA